jgi:hypothetical protein
MAWKKMGSIFFPISRAGLAIPHPESVTELKGSEDVLHELSVGGDCLAGLKRLGLIAGDRVIAIDLTPISYHVIV